LSADGAQQLGGVSERLAKAADLGLAHGVRAGGVAGYPTPDERGQDGHGEPSAGWLPVGVVTGQARRGSTAAPTGGSYFSLGRRRSAGRVPLLRRALGEGHLRPQPGGQGRLVDRAR
jgi:hypothetical protein